MMPVREALAAAILAGAALWPAVCSAQAADPRQFSAQVYLYLPTIEGESNFPASGSDPDVTVEVGQIIESLQFVFMGSFEATRGRWGAMTDVIYLNVGGDESGSRDLTIGGVPIPATASATVDYDLQGWVWMVAGEYDAVSRPAAALSVFAGTRMIDLAQKIDWEVEGTIGGIPEAGRSGNSDVGRTNWDAIAGVKGRWRYRAENRWFVPYYLDAGAGESDFTWQAMTGLGYGWQSIDVLATWRYLDYDLGEGRPFAELSLNGPLVSLAFRS